MPSLITPPPPTTTRPPTRRRMARRLGFATLESFNNWEDEIVIDHFASFICDYLALGYTITPDRKGFVEFVDLEKAVAERIAMLEERRFEVALDPEKEDWTAKDHYKQFIVGVVADDRWLATYGCDAELAYREWTPKEMTIKMFKLLEFLVREWVDGPGDATYRAKIAG